MRSLEANPLQGAVVGGRPPSNAETDQLLPLRENPRLLAEYFLACGELTTGGGPGGGGGMAQKTNYGTYIDATIKGRSQWVEGGESQ